MSGRRREMMGYYKKIQDEKMRKKVKPFSPSRKPLRCALCGKEIKPGNLSFPLLRLFDRSFQRKTRTTSVLGDRICYSCHLKEKERKT